ncbi:Uncharacterised protein [Sphingobacterium daejeonense]|nr:Uncharacterised protein [Sphingobacterium daejeonense]
MKNPKFPRVSPLVPPPVLLPGISPGISPWCLSLCLAPNISLGSLPLSLAEISQARTFRKEMQLTLLTFSHNLFLNNG